MSDTAREPSLSGLLNQFEAIGGPEEFGPEGLAIAVALWRKSSKLDWMQTFQMTNTELQVQTGIATRKTLNVYRSKLVEAGIIAYEPPPRGSSRGTYSINFHLVGPSKPVTSGNRSEEVGQEVVTSGNHLGNNFSEVDHKAVTSGYHFPKAVTSGNHFRHTVLKDLSSSAASAAEEPKSYESFYAAHKRVFGFECNPFQASKLGVYIDQDGMEEAVVIRAIERAAIASTRYRFNLITKILDDYFRAEAKTLEAAMVIDSQFEATRSVPASGHGPPKRGNPHGYRNRHEHGNEVLKKIYEEGQREENRGSTTVSDHSQHVPKFFD
ncbi:DnaD/phage-associated family protein [Paenibacillus forsythiae]|uniref:DnaD/phage-associated family protein n=1 Tax=Paenibacillus forsythiae TaxID=365616 RepID=A0ABU3H5L3_9BACL|nr:DnaD domain protein [Paenibacillus forsythiae]MDT3426102.1 DnaD/phage-associated family protein [Paenibacillus forsythiae]